MTTAISLLCSAAIACTVPAILPASTAPSYSTPSIATEAPAVSEDFTVLEQEMLDLINEARETAGLPPAQANDVLHAMAQVRAQEIMVSFSHERPNGTKVDLMREVGITPQNYHAAVHDELLHELRAAPRMDSQRGSQCGRRGYRPK